MERRSQRTGNRWKVWMIVMTAVICSMFARGAVASLPASTIEHAPDVLSTFPDSRTASDILTNSSANVLVDLRTKKPTPSIRIPEPATISLFFTAFGVIFGYRLWRHKRQGAVQNAVLTARLRVPEQHFQEQQRIISRERVEGMPHDVNNSLTRIQTYTEILSYHDLAVDERKEWSQVMSREIEQMRGMIQDRVVQEADLHSELRQARSIQQGLLPAPLHAFPAIQFEAKNEPAKEVGGDFYDYFQVSEHEFVFFIGDVCGKGVPAAIFMANTRSTLRATALADPYPAKVIAVTNHMLAKDARDDMFVTAFYGLYDSETRRLSYINAGHTNALLFRPSSNSCASLLNGNLPLGIFTPVRFQQSEIGLEPGDQLILYTDGINEAVNPQGEQFGLPRLVELILHQPPCSPKELQEAIIQAVKGFSEGQEQRDDMTVMVVQV